MFGVICSSVSAGRCTVCSSQDLPCDLLWSGSAARSQPRRWNRRRTTWVTSACPLPRTPPAGEHGCDFDKRQLYCVCTGATWDVCKNQSCMYILVHVIYTVCVAGALTFTLFVISAHSSRIKALIMYIFSHFNRRRVLFPHSDFCETRGEPIGFSVLARDCCCGAKQLCGSGQRATALYVSYLQWNLYEPRVTGTWMGPSVPVLFWRHLISAGGTHSLKVGHTKARHVVQRGPRPPFVGPECGDWNNRANCLNNLSHWASFLGELPF